MNKVRYAVLENDTAKGSSVSSGTETIDLPERGVLAQLDVQVAYKKVVVNDRALPDYLAVSKIEILVNGSTVVKSLTGRQLRALMWYNGGPFSQTGWYWANGGSQDSYTTFSIYFGLHAGDVLHGLDLSQYANAQLKITWDTSVTSIDGQTYDANVSDPTFTYNVMAKILEDKPANFADSYVQSREIDSWTVAASSERGVEIPRGFDLVGIMFGSRYKNVGYPNLFDKMRLDMDNGLWVPIDMDHENIVAAFKSWFPNPCMVTHWCNAGNADDYDTGLMQINAMANSNTGGTQAVQSYDAHEMGLHDIAKYKFDGTVYTGISITWQLNIGWGPMQTIYMPMKHLTTDPKGVIDTKEFGRIDLKVQTGSGAGSSAISRVVAEYLKPNGA